MFGSKKKTPQISIDKFASLLAGNISFTGNMEFEDGLKVKGVIQGNITHKKGSTSLLALSAEGRIEGDVSSYDALIDGTIIGDLTVEHLLELHSNARITGNITYRQLSMENGASINGTLTKISDSAEHAKVLELPMTGT